MQKAIFVITLWVWKSNLSGITLAPQPIWTTLIYLQRSRSDNSRESLGTIDPVRAKWGFTQLWRERKTVSTVDFFYLLDCLTITGLDRTYHAHHFILVLHFNFLFIPCGELSWLPVSFLLHVKYTLSYRIVSGAAGVFIHWTTHQFVNFSTANIHQIWPRHVNPSTVKT